MDLSEVGIDKNYKNQLLLFVRMHKAKSRDSLKVSVFFSPEAEKRIMKKSNAVEMKLALTVKRKSHAAKSS